MKDDADLWKMIDELLDDESGRMTPTLKPGTRQINVG